MTRDEKGHFVKGVSGNPKGRSPKQREVQYMDALVSCVSVDDWKEIITKAVTDAKRGDNVARKFIADYLIGPPVEKKEINATVNQNIVTKGVDYRTSIANLAPGSMENSPAPSEGEDTFDGAEMG